MWNAFGFSAIQWADKVNYVFDPNKMEYPSCKDILSIFSASRKEENILVPSSELGHMTMKKFAYI